MEWTLLVNCADDFEADLIIGILKEEEIIAQKKYRGMGHAMKIYGGMGRDVDIYVPAEKMTEARQILQDYKDSR